MKMKNLLLYLFTAALLFAYSLNTLAQQDGKTVRVTNDKELVAALDNQAIRTIELQPGYYAYLNFTVPEGGSTMNIGNAVFTDNGGIGGSADCEVSSIASNYCFDVTNQGTAIANLTGGYPDPCSYQNDEGTWSTISSSPTGNVATFANPSGPGSNNTTFTVPAPGIYILAYSWPDEVAPDYQAINTWRFYSKPTVDLSMSTSACGTSITVNYSYDWGTTPQPGRTIAWEDDGGSITAPVTIPTTGSGSGSFTYDFGSCGPHSIKVTFNQTLCGTVSDEASTYLYDEPTVSVDGPEEICGLEAQLSKTVSATCNNSNPIDGEWTVESGPGTANFTGDDVEVSECGEYVFRYTATNTVTGCDAYDEVTVKFFDTPSNVLAGSTDEVCGLTYGLSPATPSVNCLNGGTLVTEWLKISGPGTVTFAGNNATVSVCGTYTFEYKATNGPCEATDQVTIKYYDIPQNVNAGNDGSTCGLEYPLTPSQYSVSCDNGGTVTAVWSKTSGPGTAIFNGNDVEVSECGTYVFKYTVTNGPCSANDEVTVKFYDEPSNVDAGNDADVCGLNYTLLPATPTVSCLNGGTLDTEWSMYAGPGTATITGDDVVVSVCGTYIFRYTVTNGDCEAFDDVTVKFYDTPTNVNAGTDGSTCGLEYTLAPSQYSVSCDNGETVTAEWSVKIGPGTATFNGNDVLVSECGSYVFRYTVTNGPCSDFDEVEVKFYDTPANVDAGADDDVCGLSYSLMPAVPTASCLNGGSIETEWELYDGPGSATFTGDDVVVSVCGTYIFQYAVTNGDCEAFDYVTIKFYDTPTNVYAGDDGSTCGLTYPLSPAKYGYNCDNGGTVTAEWTLVSGTGTATFTGNDVEVSACGTYVFKYTVTNGPCSDFDEVEVKFYDTPTGVDAGDDDEVCGLAYTFSPTIGNASCLNGGSLEAEYELYTGPGVATITGNDVVVSVCGTYVFRYIVTNGDCEADDYVTIEFFDTPVADAGEDASVCGLNATLDPGYTVPCTNVLDVTTGWSFVSGPGTASFSGNNVTVSECGEYVFAYRVDNGPCYDIDEVTVKFFSTPTNVNAGTDASVCGLTHTVTTGYDLLCSTLGTVGTSWDQVSGPGTATITAGTNPGEYDIVVSECGTYEFAYYVTNSPCAPVSATVTIKFFDTPTGTSAGQDSDVCGLTTELYPSLGSVNCNNGETVTGSWSQFAGPGTASFTGDVVTVDVCGTYTFRYTTTNGPCSAFDDVIVKFFDNPVGTSAGSDDEICGLVYNLNPSLGTVNCDNGETQYGVWSLVSGPGTASFNGNEVTVTSCGEYEFNFRSWNGPCYTDAQVIINFYDDADISFDGVPSAVCGYETSFYASYDVNCDYPATSEWSYTGPGSATITAGTSTGTWNIVVSECGTYNFNLKVTNGPCEVDEWSGPINFYEIPNPGILGDLDVYTCETVTYTAEDNRICSSGSLTYEWSVLGGTIDGSNTGSSVTVIWNNITGSGSIELITRMEDDYDCYGSTSITVNKTAPLLAGQVKYWNEFETYMPTPFPTNFYGTFPEDYFYVTLYKNNFTSLDSITTVLVEPRLNEDLIELISSFEFTLPVETDGCDAEYLLKIWDGGLAYHYIYGGPNPPTVSGTYLGESYTYTNWGGGNATDALAIQLMAANVDINAVPYNYSWVGVQAGPVPPYGYYSNSIANVNQSLTAYPAGNPTITALDALTLNYRAVGLINSFPNSRPGVQYSPNFKVTGRMVPTLPYMTWPAPFYYPYNVDDVPFTHSGTSYLYFTPAIDHKYTSVLLPWQAKNNYINIYYTATGDINSSYVPTGGFKAAMLLTLEGEQVVRTGETVTIPVRVDRSAELGAITLSLSYRTDLIEVLGTNYGPDFVNVDTEKGMINIGWFSTEPNYVEADDAIAYITVRVLGDIEAGTRLFDLQANTELADANAHVIEGVNLKSIAVRTGIVTGNELTATNYPNPFNQMTTISYNLPEAGLVQVAVYNNIGQVVTVLVNETQAAGVQTVELSNANLKPGVYQYRITLQGEKAEYSVVKRMIVVE